MVATRKHTAIVGVVVSAKKSDNHLTRARDCRSFPRRLALSLTVLLSITLPSTAKSSQLFMTAFQNPSPPFKSHHRHYHKNHPRIIVSSFPCLASVRTDQPQLSSFPQTNGHDNGYGDEHTTKHIATKNRRRDVLVSVVSVLSSTALSPTMARSDDDLTVTTTEEMEEVQVSLSGEIKQLYNEARVYENQGNVPAAQRVYLKVTRIAPRFIYGWSSLGNTQVVSGSLDDAENSYSTAIDLCRANLKATESKFGIRRCDDLYVLLLNRGALRLNNNDPREALSDLEQSATLRGKPDAVILQNRARARELNGLYAGADRDYDVAISMTSNEVSPFWLRAAMVKFQLGDRIGALDLVRRVEVRFGEAPEVRAAVAAMLQAKGDDVGARRMYLLIGDRQRKDFVDDKFLKTVVAWPPKMIEYLEIVAKAVGDR